MLCIVLITILNIQTGVVWLGQTGVVVVGIAGTIPLAAFGIKIRTRGSMKMIHRVEAGIFSSSFSRWSNHQCRSSFSSVCWSYWGHWMMVDRWHRGWASWAQFGFVEITNSEDDTKN